MGPGCEDTEQGIDDIFLAHHDGDEKVGNDSVGDLPGVRLVRSSKTNEYRHIGHKSDTEEPSVNGEKKVTNISDRLGVSLINVLIIEITLPVESLLFV